MPSRQLDGLGECRTQCCADLDYRTFTADGGTAADRKRRCQCLDDRDFAADVAALVKNRVHDLRDAMALGLRGEALHHVYDYQAAEDWRQQDEIAKPARPLRQVCVVPKT